MVVQAGPAQGKSDLILSYVDSTGATQTQPLRIAVDANKRLAWSRSAAGKLIEGDANKFSSTTPIEADDYAVTDFSRGAGAYMHTRGKYAFGTSIVTDVGDGLCYPGPISALEAVDSGTPSFIKSVLHKGSEWAISISSSYKFNAATNTWIVNVGTAAAFTDIVSFGNYLIIAVSSGKYLYSLDNGASWLSPADTSIGVLRYFAVRGRYLVRPVLCATDNAGKVYTTENPLLYANWDTGVQVGIADSTDTVRSLVMDPAGLYMILAKQHSGLFGIDKFSNVTNLYGPVGGMASNFDRYGIVGTKIFYLLNGQQIIAYDQGAVQQGYDIALAGPRVPEMQIAISALAGDGKKYLYAVLSSGNVMRGSFLQDGSWSWHGAYTVLPATPYLYAWVSTVPGTVWPNNDYLRVASNGGPPFFAPIQYAAPISGISIASPCTIRTGYIDNGRTRVKKQISQCVPYTSGLDANHTMTLSYRLVEGAGFTTINGGVGSIATSPEPSNAEWAPQTIFPASTQANRYEIKVTFTNANPNSIPALEALTIRSYSRPPRSLNFSVSVLAETGIAHHAGGTGIQSAQGLLAFLLNALGNKKLCTLERPETSEIWTVDMLNVEEDWMVHGIGPGMALVYKLLFQEIKPLEQM